MTTRERYTKRRTGCVTEMRRRLDALSMALHHYGDDLREAGSAEERRRCHRRYATEVNVRYAECVRAYENAQRQPVTPALVRILDGMDTQRDAARTACTLSDLARTANGHGLYTDLVEIMRKLDELNAATMEGCAPWLPGKPSVMPYYYRVRYAATRYLDDISHLMEYAASLESCGADVPNMPPRPYEPDGLHWTRAYGRDGDAYARREPPRNV